VHCLILVLIKDFNSDPGIVKQNYHWDWTSRKNFLRSAALAVVCSLQVLLVMIRVFCMLYSVEFSISVAAVIFCDAKKVIQIFMLNHEQKPVRVRMCSNIS